MNEREKACVDKIIEHLDEAGWLMAGLGAQMKIPTDEIQDFIDTIIVLEDTVQNLRQQL
jgi:hypothetical protein